jgi:serine phosphatase RsbU (regulator of sigma subunit)/anti-sigma regulatory factor (Ser/Thr protein kinase)/putative methionine-R-sulfoxide reductase with GAF domain
MDAITLPGNLDALSPIRDYVKEAAGSAGLDHAATYNLMLAVDEIATNIILHGYKEAGLEGNISVAAAVEDDNLVIQLSDNGKSYDPLAHQEPDEEELDKELSDRPIGGLGIMLAKRGVDDLQYESTDKGNVHRFVVHLKDPPENFRPPPAEEMGQEHRKLRVPNRRRGRRRYSDQEMWHEHRKLRVLLRVCKSLGHEIQLDPLLKLIVAEVTSAMQADRSTLYLVDRNKPDELVSRVAEGLVSREIRVRIGRGIAGTTAQTRQIINIPDAYKHPCFDPSFDKATGFRTCSVLCAPILNQSNDLIGVVQVLNKKDCAVFSKEDERFLEAICVHFGIALERAVMVEAYLQSQIVTKSLELAREIQLGLVPKDFPALPEFKEVDFYATIVPALEVGGDLYDFFPLDKDRICFIVGDVSDKGVPAALFMAMTRTAFKMAATASPDSIALTMARVNQFLCESNPQQMFVTAFAGILDLRTGRVDYVDAGHEPPFILQPSRTVVKVDKVGGIVLGFLPGQEFPSGALQLNPGDALVLYTDGVTEAMDDAHRLFGAEAIEKTLRQTEQLAASERIIKVLLDGVRVFVGKASQSDDITMLVIKYLGRSAPYAPATRSADADAEAAAARDWQDDIPVSRGGKR